MLFAVAFIREPSGQLRALAPDLPGCDLRGATVQELLPRLRLALEAAVTERLSADQDLPDTREGAPPPDGCPGVRGAVDWLQIHLNLGHLAALAALAAHQKAKGPAPAPL